MPSRRHQNANSDHYVKLEPVMFHRNVLRRVPFGNAKCLLFRGKDLLAVTLELLKKDPDLFGRPAGVVLNLPFTVRQKERPAERTN